MLGKSGFVAMAGALLLAAAARADTLEEAIRLAELNNPTLESGRADAALADEDLEAARAAGRTTVSLTGQAGYESVDSNRTFAFNNGDRSTASVQLEAAKPIYTGGRIAAGIRSAEAGIDAADAALEELRQSIWVDTISAYMNVRADRETVRIRKNNVGLLEEQVRAARDRFDVGVVTRTDVALTEARLEGAIAGVAAAEAQLEASIALYASITGQVPGPLAPPPPVPPLPETLDAALITALETNPGLQAARERVRQAREAVVAAQAGRRPQLEIVGQAGGQQDLSEDTRDTEVAALVRGNVPLWTGGQVESEVRSARLREHQARLDVQRLEREVRANIASAWYGYIASERAIAASQRQVEAAEIAFDGATQELAVGTRTTLDVLDSEQNLLEARLSLVSAERDAQIAAHRLLQVMGLLDAAYLDLPMLMADDTPVE